MRHDGERPNSTAPIDLEGPVGSQDGVAPPPDSATDPTAGSVILAAEATNGGRAGGGEGRKIAANILAGGGVNLVKIGLQLVMLPLMAHLLGPAEFGIYALALPTVAFFMTLADGGLGASLAREPLHSKEVWSTAFWLVLMVGVGLGALVAGWGLLLAQLSREPQIAGVMALLAVTFIPVTAAVLPFARLTREGRLVVISAADLAGNLVGAIVAIALAVLGAGAISLAAQYVVIYLVRSVVLNAVAFVRPSFIFRVSVLTSHISTGSSLVCVRLADFSGRLVENLLLGRMFGSSALGTYTFANQVPRFVCEAASGPTWVALYAHALREDDAQTQQLHAKLVHTLALVLSPIAFLTSASVSGLTLLILGPAWSDAASFMSILIPAYAVNVIAGQCGAIFVARGAGWTNFWVQFGLVLTRIVAVLVGFWFGLTGVAWGIACALLLSSALGPLALKRLHISSLRAQIKEIAAPAVAGAVAGLVCHFIVSSAPTDVLRIALALLTGSVTYLVLIVAFEGRRLREDLIGIKRLIGR